MKISTEQGDGALVSLFAGVRGAVGSAGGSRHFYAGSGRCEEGAGYVKAGGVCADMSQWRKDCRNR